MSGIANLKANTKFQATNDPAVGDERNQKVLNAARQYETYFLREMVKAMRQATPKSELLPSGMGETIYSEQLDDQRVESWVNTGGVGLSELIYNHIMDKYGNAMNARALGRPKGPLPLEGGKAPMLWRAKQIPTQEKSIQLEMKTEPGRRGAELTSPWAGKVAQAMTLEGGSSALLIDHDNGMKSRLVFEGTSFVRPGDSVAEGQKVAQLEPRAASFVYKLSQDRIGTASLG